VVVGEARNATRLSTAARKITQRFGDLTFGISITYMMEAMKHEHNCSVPKRKTRKKSLFITIYIWNSALNIQADLMNLFFAVYLKINVI
jgi:hypothetical protein